LWYQKELFLLSKAFNDLADEASFDAYLLGPYSELAEEELDGLIKIGLVEKSGSKYQLTAKGKEVAEAIEKIANNKEKALSEEIKNFINDLTNDELLAFVYFTYPDMTEESVEVKRLIPKRKEIAVQLYRKQKVSLGKASELAGVRVDEFVDYLKKEGVSAEIQV
jgi:predicted HTH domain antitoxin